MTEAKVIDIEYGNFPHLCMGDIFKDIEYIESVKVSGNDIEISKIIFPYVVVLSQDCDLLQDHGNRLKNDVVNGMIKGNHLIISTLVAPLYNIEHVLEGLQLSELKRSMTGITKQSKKKEETTDYKRLVQNETPRYHCLNFGSDSEIPISVIDFKHYFSLNVDYLYGIKKKNFVCTISNLYKVDIIQRFASYLSRIGLPDKCDKIC